MTIALADARTDIVAQILLDALNNDSYHAIEVKTGKTEIDRVEVDMVYRCYSSGADMGIENLNSSLVQIATTLGTNDLRASFSPSGDFSGATAFFEQLAKLMADLKNSEDAGAIVEDLNADLLAATSGLPDGNILPLAANLIPQSSGPLEELAARIGLGRGSEGQPTAAALGSASKTGNDAVQQAAVAASAPDETANLTGLPATEDGSPIEDLQTLPFENEKNVQTRMEKILSDSTGVAKGEMVDPQSSIRNRPEAEKSAVLRMDRTVGEPEWKHELGDRVIWMTRNSMSAAELKVNPPHMGPVEVRIQFNQDQMNVLFASQNAAAREAIEAAVPRLKEMLGSQQLNLGNVDVSHSFADHRQQNHAQGGNGRQSSDGAFTDSLFGPDENRLEPIEANSFLINKGLLNYYV